MLPFGPVSLAGLTLIPPGLYFAWWDDPTSSKYILPWVPQRAEGLDPKEQTRGEALAVTGWILFLLKPLEEGLWVLGGQLAHWMEDLGSVFGTL